MDREEYIRSIRECLNSILNATVTVRKNCTSPTELYQNYIEVRYKHRTYALSSYFFDVCMSNNLTIAEAAYKGIDQIRDLVIKEFGIDELLIENTI